MLVDEQARAAWVEQEQEGGEGKGEGKNETQKRLCISHEVQRVRRDWTVREEKKRKRRGTSDTAEEGEDDSNSGKAGKTAWTSKEWEGVEMAQGK